MTAAAWSSATAPSPALRSFEAQWRRRSAGSGSELREQAMRRFLRLGLPTLRDDGWRHTNLRGLDAESFLEAPPPPPGPVAAPPAHLAWLGAGENWPVVYVVDGHPALPANGSGLIDGIEIGSLRERYAVDGAHAARELARLSDADHRRWALLNTALFVDGPSIKITRQVTTPLLIVHLGGGARANGAAYPRVLIEAAAGSSATVIEHHLAEGEGAGLSNSVTQIALAAGARIEHYRLFTTHAAATHFDTLEIRQAKDSRCRQYTIALGGGLVRTTLDAHLEQAGAALDAYALLVGHEARHVDCVNIATHAAPHTVSRQTARAIAGGSSRVVFNSKVVVDAGAVHAESSQSCRGLLLSTAAEIDARPQLEIHTDEVKCAHGATVGRLDPDMLFYMLSRGLDRTTARSLLVYAFLADVLTGMSVASARAAIETALIAQMPDSQVLREFR